MKDISALINSATWIYKELNSDDPIHRYNAETIMYILGAALIIVVIRENNKWKIFRV